MRSVRLAPGDERLVLAGTELFDATPTEGWTAKFLASEDHHLLVAVDDDGHPIGFVTGVETTHPDKGTEMFLYELSVAQEHRNRGVGTARVGALADLARDRGCYGMWVGTESDNAAALATYRAAGAGPPEPSVTLMWDFRRDRDSAGHGSRGLSSVHDELVARLRYFHGHSDTLGLFADASFLAQAAAAVAALFRAKSVDKVAGIEARGFVLATAVALELEVGFVALRKPGAIHPGVKEELKGPPDWRGVETVLRLQPARHRPR